MVHIQFLSFELTPLDDYISSSNLNLIWKLVWQRKNVFAKAPVFMQPFSVNFAKLNGISHLEGIPFVNNFIPWVSFLFSNEDVSTTNKIHSVNALIRVEDNYSVHPINSLSPIPIWKMTLFSCFSHLMGMKCLKGNNICDNLTAG